MTGDDEAELAAGAVGTRKQIAFYGSTPAYRKVLELHGWGDLQTELHRLSPAGEWDAMGALIDDEILDAFAVVAPLDDGGGQDPRSVRRRDRPRHGRFPILWSRRTPSSPCCEELRGQPVRSRP